MTINVSDLKGGGSTAAFYLTKLAPDLNFPSRLVNGRTYFSKTINPSGGLTEALSLTGKHFVSFLRFTGLTSESITVKLTSDGVVIWNDTFTVAGSILQLLGATESAVGGVAGQVGCETSLLLEIQTASDTSVSFTWLARPIL